jgi:hypothetical protein
MARPAAPALAIAPDNNPETPKLAGHGAKGSKTAFCNLSVSSEASMSMSAGWRPGAVQQHPTG